MELEANRLAQTLRRAFAMRIDELHQILPERDVPAASSSRARGRRNLRDLEGERATGRSQVLLRDGAGRRVQFQEAIAADELGRLGGVQINPSIVHREGDPTPDWLRRGRGPV